MAFTIEQHDALEAAIGQGALKVEYGDKRVQYRSLDEMIRILNLMKSQLGLLTPNGGRKLASYSSGIKPGCSDEKWIL